MSTNEPKTFVRPVLKLTELDERILDIKVFIDVVKGGHVTFYCPPPDYLDHDGTAAYHKRTNWFHKYSEIWLDKYQQSDFENPTFRKVTDVFHKRIVYWRAKNLVEGKIPLEETRKRFEQIKNENRSLKKLSEQLIAQNTEMAKELAKFRWPTAGKPDFTGEA